MWGHDSLSFTLKHIFPLIDCLSHATPYRSCSILTSHIFCSLEEENETLAELVSRQSPVINGNLEKKNKLFLDLVDNVNKEEKMKEKQRQEKKTRALPRSAKKKKNALDQFDEDENVNEI